MEVETGTVVFPCVAEAMSAVGQKATCGAANLVLSAPKADIGRLPQHVQQVPTTDMMAHRALPAAGIARLRALLQLSSNLEAADLRQASRRPCPGSTLAHSRLSRSLQASSKPVSLASANRQELKVHVYAVENRRGERLAPAEFGAQLLLVSCARSYWYRLLSCCTRCHQHDRGTNHQTIFIVALSPFDVASRLRCYSIL